MDEIKRRYLEGCEDSDSEDSKESEREQSLCVLRHYRFPSGHCMASHTQSCRLTTSNPKCDSDPIPIVLCPLPVLQ